MFSGDFTLEINYIISIQLYFTAVLPLNEFVMGRFTRSAHHCCLERFHKKAKIGNIKIMLLPFYRPMLAVIADVTFLESQQKIPFLDSMISVREQCTIRTVD